MQFTFKTEKPTGRYRSFFTENHYIKFKRKTIGSIDSEFPFKIRFMVIKKDIMEDGNGNCEWKWIALKKESESLQAAKDFINLNANLISQTYNLKLLD